MTQDVVILEIEEILERLEVAYEQCLGKLLSITEVQEISEKTGQKVEKLLALDSNAFRVFNEAKQRARMYWSDTKTGFASDVDCANINEWIKILRKVLREFEPEFLYGEKVGKKQYTLPAGDIYHTRRLLLRIMQRAKINLAVVDRALDAEILTYIELLDASVDIQLLAPSHNLSFRNFYGDLKTKRSNFEAREYHDCQGIFLIIDNSEVWQLNNSINVLNKEALVVGKVTDLSEANQFVSDFNTWWSKGSKI